MMFFILFVIGGTTAYLITISTNKPETFDGSLPQVIDLRLSCLLFSGLRSGFRFSRPTPSGTLRMLTFFVLVAGGETKPITPTTHQPSTTNGPPPKPIDLRFTGLPLCLHNKIVMHYLLEEPPQCAEVEAKKTTTFVGDIYPPPPAQHVVSAASCSASATTAEHTFYFFGAKITETSKATFSAVSAALCNKWEYQRYDAELGTLKRIRPGSKTFSTERKVDPV